MNTTIKKENLDKWNLKLIKEEADSLYFMSLDDSDRYQEMVEYLTEKKVFILGKNGKVLSKSKKSSRKEAEDTSQKEKALVEISDQIIKNALHLGASDIHLEPLSDKLRIRLRIDGKLKFYKSYPLSFADKMLVRLKILAGLDISQKKLPQDGRFFIEDQGEKVDIRLSTSPIYNGEKIVLRLLKKRPDLLTMEGLGLNTNQINQLNILLHQSNGLILFTGPTNSGKTTSIYALLQQMNTESLNIMTIEDPIEYQMEGINQMQVNPIIKMDFSQGLRTMLRQDPDILMVGEIRNAETAQIAIRAAITGRLLFSTIHTRDAISAIYRLQEMGVEPYYIADGVLGVVAQRLLTTLCPYCKRPVKKQAPAFFKGEELLYEPVGCERCNHGHLGRKAVFELVLFKDWLVDCINKEKDLAYIKNQLAIRGIPNLKDRIKEELLQGNISLEEAYRCLNTI